MSSNVTVDVNPIGALQKIVQQFKGVNKQDLTVLEGTILRIASEALYSEIVYNKYGEVVDFKVREV